MKETTAQWIAWKLPRRLIAWCFVRVVSYATTGDYKNTEVTKLPAMDALDRWNKQP